MIAPLAGTIYYLYTIAEDQYASSFGFAVRSEEIDAAQSLLGGLSSTLTGGNSSSDTDILYEFIKSQTMVETIDADLDLYALFSRPEQDPVFAFDADGSIEELVEYWQRMVTISYATGSGMLQIKVKAFTPEDAHGVAQAIVTESGRMINELSAIAREDATRYAREDLETAVTRLKNAREALTRFRSETRIVDPNADLQGQMGLLNSLEEQLATAIIELNLLMDTARDNDPRVEQASRRIEVIQSLIEKERAKFGMGGTTRMDDGRDYSTLVGEFERLMVDVEYAQESYLAAQTVLDTAQAEAQRQSRYLATFIKPSLPQSSQYPEREILSLFAFGMLFLIWAIGVLIYYSLRDRR